MHVQKALKIDMGLFSQAESLEEERHGHYPNQIWDQLWDPLYESGWQTSLIYTIG